MAKKKKTQDTSPLAMGRQQKGSAANKRASKAGTNTKSQSSASSKSVSSGFTVGYRRSSSGTSGGSRGSSSSSSNNRISSGFTVGYRANNSRSANAPTSRNVTQEDRRSQRSYGATRRGTTPTAAYRQRTTPATAEEMRTQNTSANNNLKQTQAEKSRTTQRQTFSTAKEMMAARRQTNEQVKAQNAKEWERVKNTSKEEQQAWFTKKAQEAQQRRTGKVEKGTDNLATSAAKSAFHGAKGAVYSLYGALTRASFQVENETQRDKALAALRGEDVNQAESVAREKAKKRQDLKLAGIRAKAKAEQEKVEEIKEAEAAKDKGPIPLRKMAVGAASFTGQRVVDTALLGPYSLASMGARVLEDERNAGQEKNERLKKRLAESGQFTQEELDEEFKRMDRRSVANAYASSGIEILSELMFGGIGLSKKYMPEGTRGILDKTVGKLFGNIGKTAAGRLGLGIAEETAEEWIANPVQARVSNMLTGNRLQSLQEESVRREYQKQAMDLKEMQATSADINSDAFLERAKEIYKESGATDKEASRIAELARDYFNADIIGDSDTADAKLAEITNILAGGENDLREKWTLKDALEVAGEMIFSVGAEGFAGAVSSSAAGNEYKANYGIEGVRKLAKVVENLDADKSDRAKAIIDDIDNGKDITGTQVSQIMEWSNETALKAQDREITRDNLVQNRMKDEKLFVPIIDSEYNLSPATDARFEEISDRVVDNIDNMGIKMSDVDAYAIADVVAAYETGTISAEQMNELNVENPEARAVFERETGINLDQYTVKDKRGNIKVAESNIKMQKALFSNAADNYMASARIEQENWNNVERGRAAESLTSDMDGMGGVGIQRVLESVDPRNRGDFMLAGSVARRVYDHARLTNDSWEDVRKDFKNAFPGATMDESMRYVYDMAKRTKAIAETKYYGKQVSNKQSLSDSETMYVPGNFTNNSERMLGNTELSTLTNMATTLGVNIVMSDNMANKNANGSYDSSTRTITLNAEKSMGEMLQFVLAHEVTHHLAAYAPDEYLKLSRFVMDKAYKADAEKFEAAIKNIQKKYKDQAKQDLTPEQALEEIIADNAHEFWQDEAFINDVTSEEPTLAQSIINAVKDILNKLRSVLASGNITDENDRQFLFDEIDSYDQTYKLWTNAFRVARDNQANQAINDWQDDVNAETSLADVEANERFSISEQQREELNADGVDITQGGSAVKYSLTSWLETDILGLKAKLLRAGFEENEIDKWIADVNSVASLISADMGRLNYEADQFQDALKPNSEYFFTLDLSTLCQKRRLYQGTYNAIMHQLVNVGLHPEDTIRLRRLMDDNGYEVPCGICYEESRKKNEGKFAERWIEEYNSQEHDDSYKPTVADVTTTDGRAKLREEHPEVLESYLDYQKGRGSANPKVSFTHTDYRGDILRMTKKQIENVKHIGGLRIQSFSDFEVVHVIDMMQAIMDMSAQNLTSQAYTKVPAFADIFGGTGVKINLSLIQKMDENGNPVYDSEGRLVFDSKEGIDPKEAFRIREKYSDNVGTILVGVSNQQILDAWADPRIDMVIPFHRSGWGTKEFEELGLVGYDDFQAYQSERYLDGSKNGITLSDAKKAGYIDNAEELYSADYWDYSKTGKENAEKYLQLCAEQKRRPVFYNFLHDNGDGTWSLQEDGSTDGYWKSLIDFKMYDNEGKGAPQEEVKPNFDMDVAQRVMGEYEGNADTLPVADDVVEAFVKEYAEKHPDVEIADVRYSISARLDEPYMTAVNEGNMEEAQRLVEEAAKMAGYGIRAYHGTSANFTVFEIKRAGQQWRGDSRLGPGFYFAHDEETANKWTEGTRTINAFLSMNNPLDYRKEVPSDIKKKIDEHIADKLQNYDDSYPLTREQYANNLQRIKDMYNNDFSLFIDNYKYDENGNMTDGIHELLSSLGYDGIISDREMVVFEPSQIKSADTVTYAEDGSVIPLSERFNPESNDIRYSLPTQDADGKVLSDDQMDYFKSSQARDEEGRLVPVYHTTNKGGFTIFDPSYSDDHRSLFFASNFDVSQTYGKGANQPLYTYEINSLEDFKHYLRATKKDVALSIMNNETLMKNYISEENMHQAIDEGYIKRSNNDFVHMLIDEGQYMDKNEYMNQNPGASMNEYFIDAYNAGVEEGWINPDEWTIGVTIPNTTQSRKPFVYGKSIDSVISVLNARLQSARTKYDSANRQGARGYYKTYLNLENPLIVDAKGDNWNRIYYSEDGTENHGLTREEALKQIEELNLADYGVKSIDLKWDFNEDGNIVGVSYDWNCYGLEDESDWEWRDFTYSDSFRPDIEDESDLDDINKGIEEMWDWLKEELYVPQIIIDDLMSDFFVNSGTGESHWESESPLGYDFIKVGEFAEGIDEIENFVVDNYIDDSKRYTTRQLAEIAQNDGHDGVIVKNCRDIGPYGSASLLSDIYIAFSSNQVKDVDNLNPTENPDIRYSISDEDEAKSKLAYDDAIDNSFEALEYYEQRLADLTDEAAENRPIKKFNEDRITEFYAGLKADDSVPYSDYVLEEDRVRMAKSKNDYFNNINAKWNDRWTTDGEVLNVKSVKSDVRNLIMGVMQNSDTDSQYKRELVNKTLFDIRTAYQLMKQDRPEVAAALLYHSAQRMIDNVDFYEDGGFDEYKKLRDYLRNTRISVGEDYWSDVDYDAFRKNNFGRLKLVKGRTNVDQVYQELEEMFPEWFNEEETMTVPDQLLQIEHVLDSVQPYKEAYSSEAAAELAFDIADDLYEIMVNGDEVRSLADTYKQRYDEKTKAMKQRHAEAMLRMRKARDEGVQAERAKWRARDEARKERQDHSKHFSNIQKNYNWLKERLLTNTKDKHIPEQYKKDLAGLLAAFDLQTVGSKKLEAKRGYQAQKTIHMSAIRTGLNAMHEAYPTFYIHDSITDKIDALAKEVNGKTIDELTVTQLQEIDDILKGLKSDFINYDRVMVKGKKIAAADAGKAEIKTALDHVDEFGAAKDYQNLPGVIDKLINLDEMTAPYLFRRIDPDNTGLGMMYGEIRRGFDKYVRNQSKLNDWMEEIVGKYHQKGILWNKYGSGELSDWRSDTHAKTFNFEGGPLRLTPAQMMSLYCLSKRPQAMNHILQGGVVAAPVSFNAKMLSDIKGKVNKAVPTYLTGDDIKQIVAELTPEQIQVATQLQELMSTKMAEWGNEASMDVMDIELFKEKEYFPIKSDQATLTKDLNDSEFVQAVRNFGFTKALTPNAGNTIVIDDIFDVVAEHCNNMNLYNAYSKAFDDFMKVYNYKDYGEDGTGYTVQQAVAHAYSQKATTFIMTLLRDLNGNVSGRASGVEDAYNTMLGNAKKAAVFANFRVAAQQPTAITRAFYVIDPKYLKGVKIEKGAMKEMFEHCPIALWKSWGYYDINMGKSIEDIMMNNGRWLEDKATDLYGKLDNVTWTAIWQMVKNEMKDTHPDVEIGTDEYWDLCNERMSEVVDLTQVVDSPLHRSHGMRSKNFLVKTATAFMAEPTLTFNMLRDGYIRSAEARRRGKILLAGQIASRVIAVGLLQAVTVAGASGLVDALRGKNPDKDDDDERFLHLWWVNFIENFKDELKIWNKIYVVKDIASQLEGWDNANLALQGLQKFSLGWRQIKGDPYARSSASWYENMADGLGYMFGVPVKTMRTGIKNAMDFFGIEMPEGAASYFEHLDDIAKDNKKKKQSESKGEATSVINVSSVSHWYDYENNPITVKDGSTFDRLLNHFGLNLTKAEKAAALRSQEQKEFEQKREEIKESVLDYTGEEKAKKTWSKVTTYLKEKEGKSVNELVESGDFATLAKYRTMFLAAGNSEEYFDSRIYDASKKALKKSIVYDATDSQINAQENIKDYLLSHGMTEAEMSDIAYRSDTARDMKVAFRLGDKELMMESLEPLVNAGLTYEDLERLWKNRNRVDLKKYDGRYKDRLKSTGNYVFPVDGIITSDFGHRESPGGIGSTDHKGLDIGAAQGTPVAAADGGIVVMAGWYGGYGKTVQVQHDDGTITQYSHLSWWDVNEGDTVAQGQEVGLVGSTGNSTGPHLHFGVLKNGEYVDPKGYIETADKQWDTSA